jgi:uncharacterized protein (UPF0335 family)
MAKGVSKPKDGEEAQTHGSNVPDGAKILEFVQRVENLDQELASKKGEFMQECKVIAGDKKEVYSEAKAAGLNKKALKGIVKQRALQREIEEIASDLEGDDSDAYAAMDLALEKLKAAA